MQIIGVLMFIGMIIGAIILQSENKTIKGILSLLIDLTKVALIMFGIAVYSSIMIRLLILGH